MDALALLAESRIRAAIGRGEFDDLPGKGKPLDLSGDAQVPPELRMGLRLPRNADCLPPELEARKEVAQLGALIAATGDPEERARLSRRRTDAELRYAVLSERRPARRLR